MAEQMVPIFRVENARDVVPWYGRLGFEVIGAHRFGDGFPLYVFLRRGRVHLHLSEHMDDAPRGSVAYFYVEAATIATFAAEFGVAATLQPWGSEIELDDPCGNHLRIGVVERG